MKQAKLSLLFFLSLAAGFFPGAAGAVSSLNEKVRYEEALEQKGEAMLVKVLGPNKARLSVEALLKMESSGGKGEGASGRFAWLGAAKRKENMKELLPGYTAPVSLAPMDEEEASAYSFKVERLTVTVVASKDLTQAEAVQMTDLLERVLGLDRKRGDALTVVRAEFAPAWKSILYSPDSAMLLFRYGLIAAVIIFSFLIMGFGILRLANAMGSMAKAQEHEVSIGFEGGGGRGDADPEAAGQAMVSVGQVVTGHAQPGMSALAGPGAGEGGGKIVFNVRKEHLPVLVNMLKKEDPENISLVVYHLPDAVRGELLSALGKELASKVILQLATVRFVEREMVEEIKEELEKRLDSAVGGVDKVVELISPMRYTDRKELIKNFEKYNPPVASEIRKEIVLDEDLVSLSENELGLLSSAVKVSDWAAIFPSLPEDLKGRIKAQLPANSVKMVEETAKYTNFTPRQLDEGIDKFMATVMALVREGKIKKPEGAGKLIGLAAGAAPAAKPAPAGGGAS